MLSALYGRFSFPESCSYGKRVYKKLFQDNAALGITDKKAFSDDIDTITWQYALKPNTIAIPAYQDDQREYLEVALLEVNLKTQRRTGRISEVIHRAIPYPVILVLGFEHQGMISLAHKRFSQAEQGAIVVEAFFSTGWMDLTALSGVQSEFLDSLSPTTLAKTHFFAYYSGWVDRVVALNCAQRSGRYVLEDQPQRKQARLEKLARCRDLDAEIAELRAAIQKETQFNRRFELNTRIKQLESTLNELSVTL